MHMCLSTVPPGITIAAPDLWKFLFAPLNHALWFNTDYQIAWKFMMHKKYKCVTIRFFCA